MRQKHRRSVDVNVVLIFLHKKIIFSPRLAYILFLTKALNVTVSNLNNLNSFLASIRYGQNNRFVRLQRTENSEKKVD